MLRLEGIEWEGDNRTALGEKLVLETTERNVRMVAGWQMYATAPAMRLVDGTDLYIGCNFTNAIINTDK